MLSYQHGFHAGNLADVHKHSLLAWMLDYMTAKPKPLSYLETHAGRALYDLTGADAVKTGEAAAGIGRVADWFGPAHPYGRVLSAVRAKHGAAAYPGSPIVAGEVLRFEDNLTLAELHPQEAAALRDAMGDYPATVVARDGFAEAISRTPPDPRRGLLLCDPSYEVKTDYRDIPDFFAKLHRRWPVGVLVLWYPVLTTGVHVAMVKGLVKALPEGFSHEVQFAPARPGHGMIGSGLFVVNPPYGLHQQAAWLSAKFKALEANR